MANEHMDVRRRAAEIVESGWMRGQNACDREGLAVSPLSTTATKWCAGGAVSRALWEAMGEPDMLRGGMEDVLDRWSETADAIRRDVEMEIDVAPLWRFNDNSDTTREQVVAALRGEWADKEEAS